MSPESGRAAVRLGERAMELRYMGFQQKQNRRLYRFDMNDAGTKSSIPHVVSVDMDLFLRHHVGIQEGPALCAQKINADIEADRAIAALNGTELNGRALNINEARPKSDSGRSFRGGGGGGGGPRGGSGGGGGPRQRREPRW